MSQTTKSAALTVSIKDLSPLMSALLDEGKEIRFTVTGNSMGPFLRHKRDQAVLVKPADPTSLQVGDVPLYRRDNGQLVLHRIVERDDGQKRYLYGERDPLPSMHVDGPLTYTMLGDAQTVSEPNVRPEQIMAVATAFMPQCGLSPPRRVLAFADAASCAACVCVARVVRREEQIYANFFEKMREPLV